MTLRDVRRFSDWLKTENASHLGTETGIIEPFYPHDFLKANELANLLFLKGTEDEVERLVAHEYNRGQRIYLRHYLDTDGSNATVPDAKMSVFVRECLKQRGLIEFTPPTNSIEANDRVQIISGPFAGQEATVTRVQLSRGSISLDLEIPFVTGAINIRMSNVNKRNVRILDREQADAIRTDFIEYTQLHLLTILEHRVKRVTDETVNRRDADMLTRLYRYRHHHVNNEAACNHFMALMLICAHLCRFTADEAALRQQALDKLDGMNRKSEQKAATDTRAYLQIALYISTNNPAYRDALKQYVRDHQPKSARLRRFIYLIRKGKKI